MRVSKLLLCQVSNSPALMNILKCNTERNALYAKLEQMHSPPNPLLELLGGGDGGNQYFQAALTR